MNSRSLLPDNASPLEHNLAQTGSMIERIPVPLRSLWQADCCPSPLLPYLAWAFSVDRWDEHWPEETKRQVIAASFYIHQHKGTIGALQRAVEPFGFLIRVTEWWQEQPEGIPGTFALEVGVREQGITEQMYAELERLIDDAKPCSRHLIGLAISLQINGYLWFAATSYTGDTLTIYPFIPDHGYSTGRDYRGAALHLIDTLRIAP
ncbi:phage tail protein I [Edwardsiella ictaluri]|uniref:phage tail protein I n=1 Tax=Edwardsiella ictaluri TaxID=67780 RepID=UPI0037844D57